MYLTEIGALFTDRKVSFLIGAPKQSGIIHVFRIGIVRFLSTKGHPEEIIRFFAFVQHLQTYPWLLTVLNLIITTNTSANQGDTRQREERYNIRY